MNKSDIFIRVDATAKIGMGHLIRCIALAQMLIDDFNISFICKSIPHITTARLKQIGIDLIIIEDEWSISSVLSPRSIIVIDHYDIGFDYHRFLKGLGHKVVCIDDLHDKEFYADLIINHSPGISVEDYNTPFFTQFALGSNYVLLRPSFLRSAGKSEITTLCENYFVCFGGSDPKGLTQICVEILLTRSEVRKISVVVGPVNESYEKLAQLGKVEPKLNIYSNIAEEEMLRLMQQSHVAIVPASGILLEAHSAGCKLVSGMFVENQKFIYSNYKKANLFIDAGNFSKREISNALDKCQQETKTEKVFDGKSGKRLLKIFHNLKMEDSISLRRATHSDLEITYRWATNEIIRKYAYNSDIIQYKDHQSWFKNRIDSPDHIYLIAEAKEKIIGSLRYDIIEDEAVVSYLVDPEFHGIGYGLILLKKGLNKLLELNIPEVEKVVGYVMEQNIASVKVFNQLGYQIENKKDQSYKFFKKINDCDNR